MGLFTRQQGDNEETFSLWHDRGMPLGHEPRSMDASPRLPQGLPTVPLVTVGMPVYNGARYLEAAVRSFQRQTHSDFVLVISDNCSTDETPTICASLAKGDPRIRYVRQESNLGSARNFEYLIRSADSHYFTWAAHDDTRQPEFLEETLRLLQSDPDAIGCAIGVDLVDESGRFLRYAKPPLGLASQSPAIRARAVREQGYLAIYGLLRLAKMQFDLSVPDILGSDTIFVHRLAMQGRFVVCARPLLVLVDRPIATRQAGSEGYLYQVDARWRDTHRLMLRDTKNAPLPRLQKIRVSAGILAVDFSDWRRVMFNAAKAQRESALARRRRFEGFLLSLGLVALCPLRVARHAVRHFESHR